MTREEIWKIILTLNDQISKNHAPTLKPKLIQLRFQLAKEYQKIPSRSPRPHEVKRNRLIIGLLMIGSQTTDYINSPNLLGWITDAEQFFPH